VLRTTFARNLADRATVTASNTRGSDANYSPANALAADPTRYWAADDTARTAELTLTFPAATTLDVIRLREPIALGQRVDAFAIDAWIDGAWQEVARGTSVGSQRLVRLAAAVTTPKLRLHLEGAASPALAEWSVFALAPAIEPP
jgi:alpha-L-fucosidase